MMPRFVCLIISLILFVPFEIHADPKITIRYEYYEISGSSERELRRQMNRYGIKWTDGKTYDALTRWYVRWRYEYSQDASNCDISTVSTFVKVEFKFPKWVDKDRAPKRLQRKWERYMKNLLAHENGHKNFGVRAAAEIEQAIAGIPGKTECADLGDAANARGHQILDKYVRMEKEYDRKTGHGRTQGAVFP